MGLMDDLMDNPGGLSGIMEMAAKNPQLVAAAATLLSSKDDSVGGTGGLGGLMEAFEQKGLGSVVGSWVSSGRNDSIGVDDLIRVLGSDTVREFADKAGISLSDAGPALAAVLPILIDRLTPKGKPPEPSLLESAIGEFLSRR